MNKPAVAARAGIALFCAACALQGQFSPQQLVSADPSLRQSALRQLAALPEQERSRYVPDLVGLLHDRQAYRALPAFAAIGPAATPALVGLLDDPTPAIRGFAGSALANIRPVGPENVGRLRRLLKDEDTWVRRRAAESLLSIGVSDEEAQSIIRDMWQDSGIPKTARRPAGNFSDWIQLLSSDDISVSATAGYALTNAGPSAVPNLIDALKSPNPDIRAGAANALWSMLIYGADIEAAFIQALADPSARVRESARNFLNFDVTKAAMDALLQDEIAEVERKKEAELLARLDPAQPRSRTDILAAIPSDPDHKYPLEARDQFELSAPDGTRLFIVIHKGKGRGDLLRIWNIRSGEYFLLREQKADGSGSHLSANGFRYQGKLYLHTMELWDGTGAEHTDDLFRIESGALHIIATPQGLPLTLASKEGVWKGLGQIFKDDELEFEFGIYNEGDANCCPTAGLVTGTYDIVGDELKYATWNRSETRP
jgi:HEAT repeat protein